ncbi:dihydroorotase [Dactylosporangium sp. CA-092794]|uniref:dihydroorotase n=1 Tax=Dactylosporangium sp. CA-092794 TaxID=3239929 RepID=UPI003D93EB15
MRSRPEANSATGDAPWVLRGGRLFTPGRDPAVADLVVAGGTIAALAPPGTVDLPDVVDADGLDVLPGAIDLHVHFRDPGQTHKETVETGTAAAACGGTTLVCDMPSTQPQVVTAERYRDKRRSWTGRAAVDFALWAGGTDPAELAAMAAEGAIGVKVYMATSPGFEQLYSPDRETVRRVLAVSGRLGWAVSVHAGDQAASDAHRDRLIRAGRRDPAAVLEVNRGPGNLSGLRIVLDLAAELGGRVHLAHLSAYGEAALELFLRARAAHPGLTAESCFPALSEEEDLPRQGVDVLPTVFAAPVRQRLLRALADGGIDAVATDHAPHTRREKDPGRTDAWAAPAGYPAVETSLPLAYDAVLRGLWPPRRFADAVAAAPARILGLPGKGGLRVGADADLVLADPASTWLVDQARLHSKVGWSPFHGRRLHGRLRTTYVRGRPVAHDGEILDPGTGRFVGRPGPHDRDDEAGG